MNVEAIARGHRPRGRNRPLRAGGGLILPTPGPRFRSSTSSRCAQRGAAASCPTWRRSRAGAEDGGRDPLAPDGPPRRRPAVPVRRPRRRRQRRGEDHDHREGGGWLRDEGPLRLIAAATPSAPRRSTSSRCGRTGRGRNRAAQGRRRLVGGRLRRRARGEVAGNARRPHRHRGASTRSPT